MTGAPPMLIGMPGGTELVIILIVGLLIFGGRLPQVARSIGRSIQEFKGGLRDLEDQVGSPLRDAIRETRTLPPPVSRVTEPPMEPRAAEEEPACGDRDVPDAEDNQEQLEPEEPEEPAPAG